MEHDQAVLGPRSTMLASEKYTYDRGQGGLALIIVAQAAPDS